MSTFEGNTPTGRITSLFGTYMPPKRKFKASRHLTITFMILGTIPSKKNHIWAASNFHFVKKKLYAFKTVASCINYLSGKQGLKVFIQNSKVYNGWVKEQTPKIHEQAKVWNEKFKAHGLRFPLDNVSVKVYHYWKDNIERDLTNKADSINDLMVAAGIIKDDNWQIIRQIHSEGEMYRGEILQAITRVDITQSYFD